MSNSQTVSDPINTTFQITFLIQVLFDNSQNDNQTTKQPNNQTTKQPNNQTTSLPTYHLPPYYLTTPQKKNMNLSNTMCVCHNPMNINSLHL
jgi:hypothetical protein